MTARRGEVVRSHYCGGAIRLAILRDRNGSNVVATCDRCGERSAPAPTEDAAIEQIAGVAA